MATQIGPRIGIEGEAEYRRQIQGIITQTKTLGTEMKALTASFDKDNKSIKQNSEQRKKLNQMLQQQQQLLKKQEQMMLDSSMATDKNGQRTDALREKTEKWKQTVNGTQAEINRLQQELKGLPTTLEMVGKKFDDVGKKMQSAGKWMTSHVTAPIVAGFGASIKSAIDWESAFTGVMKTVDETATTSYDDIAKGITEIAKTTASSRGEIAGVAEVAGQLGISADNVVEFTKTMVMLGDTTNLSADEAATSLARIMNITGDSADSIDRLGSVIVDLGNNMATSESEIVAMSNRLAASGTLAGLSTQEIMALSAAMTSVGIQAEAGGTAMTQTLTNIEQQVAAFATGADSNLGQIAEIAGMSAEEFASAWESKPIEAIQAFITGLGDLDEKGESATLILDELGMSGIRQSNMLKSLALASETLGDAIGIANNAYEENTALGNEAAKRYGTMAAKLNQLKERFVELGVRIGELLMPYVEQLVEGIGNLVDWLANLDPSTQKLILTIAAIAAAIGPILTLLNPLVLGIGKLIGFISSIIPMITSIGAAIGAMSLPMIGLVAAIAGLILVGTALYANWDTIKAKAIELKDGMIEAWNNIVNTVSTKYQEIVEGARGMVANMASAVLGQIGIWISSIQQLIQGAIDTIASFFTGMYQKGTDLINEFINGAKGMLSAVTDIGVQIVNGVWNGIQSMIGTFTNNVTNFFSNIVDGVKNSLGIQSPSKVFAEIGKYMGMGLEQGWAKEIKHFNPGADIQMKVPTVDMLTGIGYGNNTNYSFTNNITMNGEYRERDGYNIAMSIDRWLGAQV